MNDLVQLADFAEQWNRSRESVLSAVERVGRSGWLVLGKEVELFERELAEYWGVRHAIGVGNGLDALELILRALGARPGDVFLTTPLSAFATTLAILRVGGIPVFADVDASGCIDLQNAAAVIEGLEVPPRFFLPVHLFGHCMDLEALEAFARSHGLVVVEDCAQSIGASSNGRAAGSVGIAAATSFYPTKNLGALGDGGAVLTNDVRIEQRIRWLRDYGQTAKYVHDVVGLNSRLDELQAAILRSAQLPMLGAYTARRRQIAARYLSGIVHRELALPTVPANSNSVWHLFPLLVNRAREGFRAHLREHGVATAVHYPKLIPKQLALVDAGLSPPAGRWPVAQRFADNEVSIPLHPFMGDEDVERVIDACNSWPVT